MTGKVAPPVTVIEAGSRSWRREQWRLSSIWRDCRASRDLARRLVIRNLRAQYRQTLLGFAWALIPPLATTALFVYLRSSQVVAVESIEVPYPIFILTGLILWYGFLDAVAAPLKNITEAKPMLAKVHFPREALIVAGVAEVLFNFTIRLLLWGAALVYFGFLPAATIPLALIGVGSMLVLATAIGVLLTPLGLLYQDIGRGVTIFGQFWLFLTPILYQPLEGNAAWWNVANPVSPLLITTRHWMVGGGDPNFLAFAVVSGIAALALIGALLLYRLSMPIVIERMSA